MPRLQKIKLIGHLAAEVPFSAGTTGRTDINTFTADYATANWADTEGYDACHARMGYDASFGTHTGVRHIKLNDFINMTARIGPDPSKAYSGAPAGPFTVWSARYYFNFNGMPGNDSFVGYPNYVSTLDVMNGSTKVSPLVCCDNIFPRTNYAKLTVPGAGVGFSPAGKQNQWQRCEIQYNEAFTPQMVMRLYDADNTTPHTTWTWNPAFGGVTGLGLTSTDNGQSTTLFPQQVSIALLEFSNTYDLDGTANNGFPGGTASVCTTTNPSGTGTPETEQTLYTFPSTMIPRTGTVVSLLQPAAVNAYEWIYGFSPARRATVWVPGGTPKNPNGWPVVFWSHGGFFITGDRNQIPLTYVNTLLNAGYAVVSVQYALSTVTGGTYPAYGTDTGNGPEGGRYPSWIVDYKLCAARLADEATAQGWDLDTSRMFATGFSAGSYISTAAAITEGVTNDGTGTARNLTIAGNPTYADGYVGADPTFIGAVGYGTPLDLQAGVDYDLTDPGLPIILYGLFGLTDRGLIAATARCFLGLAVGAATADLTNCDMPNLVEQRDLIGAIPPTMIVYGTADYLVPEWVHSPQMATAMSTAGANYTVEQTPTIHDWLPAEFEPAPLLAFLDTQVTASGGVPGVIPTSTMPSMPTHPSIPTLP